MVEIFFFWLHYILAGILLYTSLRSIYVKGKKSEDRYPVIYYKTDSDQRLKTPLWVILLLSFAFFVPILNLVILGAYLMSKLINEDGSKYCKYYCKSLLTKEY